MFITGSADGLGRMTARLLVQEGHQVVLHARNASRAREAQTGVPQALGVVQGDLSSIAETRQVAEEATRLGPFDAVIHNAGVYLLPKRGSTPDGLPEVFAINTLAPYILTCCMERPKRLVYVSSGMGKSGDASLRDLTWDQRRWNASAAYADSKLHDVLLAFAVARYWTGVYANAVDPGWVATKMGGTRAPGTVEEGSATQAWLASSADPGALVSGHYFYHLRETSPHPAARDQRVQEQLLKECARLSGVNFPAQ